MRWKSRLWTDNENIPGPTPSGSAGYSGSRLSQAELQRINQGRMFLAQKQVENTNTGIGRSETLNMGYVPRNYTDPSGNYCDPRSQTISSSFTPVSTVYQPTHNTIDNYHSSTMEQHSELNNTLPVSQSTSQVSTKDDNQERVNLRHQLLLEVLAQINVNKNKSNVAKRKLNSGGGVAFDWGKMPRIGSVHSVQGIVESSPALGNQITATSQLSSSNEKESTRKDQSLSKEQIPITSKMNISELAQLILNGTFDGLLSASSAGNTNEQRIANKRIDFNRTLEPTQATRAPIANSSQLNRLGSGVQSHSMANNIGTTTSIQPTVNNRLLDEIASKIIVSYNQQNQEGNVPFGQTTYNNSNQLSSYSQRTGTNNNAYERSVATSHSSYMNNVHRGSHGYANSVSQGYITAINQSPRAVTSVNQTSARFVSQGHAASFRSQPVHQGIQAGTAYQRPMSTLNQTPVNQSHVVINQAAFTAHRGSVATGNQTPLGTNQHLNAINYGRGSATLDRAAMKRLRDANIERFQRELLRVRETGQSYTQQSTSISSRYHNGQARTARVFPIMSCILSQETATPEPVKSTNPINNKNLLEAPHDSMACTDCLLLGTCPIKKSNEANKAKESAKDDEDDVVITKVTTKDDERGPIERIDVDDWIENASSLPERITIKQEPVEETSFLTKDQSEVNTAKQTGRPCTQQQTFQEIELSPIDETPMFTFPVMPLPERLGEAGNNSIDENKCKDDALENEKGNEVGVEHVITAREEGQSLIEEETTRSGGSGPSPVECNGNETSSLENAMISEHSLQETADRKEETETQINGHVLRSYDDILHEILTTHDKITLTDLERKLEENGNKLKTQTVSWIRKNMLKARLSILKKIERIRNKYEQGVKTRMEKQTAIVERKTVVEAEKEGKNRTNEHTAITERKMVVEEEKGLVTESNGQDQHLSDNVQGAKSAMTCEPTELKSELQVYEEGDQDNGNQDANVKDEPMTLEEAIKSLDDIPLPNEEKEAIKKPSYSASDVTDCSSENNEILNSNILSEHSNNESKENDGIVSEISDKKSNEDSNKDNNVKSVTMTEDSFRNMDDIVGIGFIFVDQGKVEDTESKREYRNDSSPGNPNAVLSPIYERKAVSTDNEQTVNGHVGSESDDENAQMQHKEKYEQKIGKRKSLHESECEIKRKKEKTDETSSRNIWERLNSKYSFS
ncbi:uncharacterized protein LOC110242042 isoform X2 [Exaiptasia diaphana]|uniref:Uncharacterized protein n=1 Tax=Exaiptasia diaphana TaxID=2652724 RepID=A0A913XFH4_EXADI|nr:uncharacterized protein LOC110242042 isoform X2 [Exaiptasia diaphana]